jgi:hypothetical protein
MLCEVCERYVVETSECINCGIKFCKKCGDFKDKMCSECISLYDEINTMK